MHPALRSKALRTTNYKLPTNAPLAECDSIFSPASFVLFVLAVAFFEQPVDLVASSFVSAGANIVAVVAATLLQYYSIVSPPMVRQQDC